MHPVSRVLIDGWEVRKLGEVCELYQPKTISSKEMVEDGQYPVFGANGIIGKYNKYNHEESQLLITCRGATCGSVNISLPQSWINGNAMVVRPIDNSLDIKFVEYLFRGGIDISKTITGAAQPQITRQTLSPVLIFYPKSLPEQQKIVAILDEAFGAIEKAKTNAKRNLTHAKELFESYLQSVFENRGEGWEEKTLGEIATVKSGGTPSRSKKEYWEGNIAWYSSGELNDLFTQEPERYINDLAIKNSSAKLFPIGSLLIGMYDTAALKMSIIDRDASFNQAIAGVEPNKNINLIFILHSINSIKPEILNL